MAVIKFKAGNSWPLLRVLEAAVAGDTKTVGLSDGEMVLLRQIMSSCKVQQESGSVHFRSATVESLTVLMKALDVLATKCGSILGEENGLRGTAQARSLRHKVMEVKTRLDLTGGL